MEYVDAHAAAHADGASAVQTARLSTQTILDQFYGDYRRRYPHVLTFKPAVDCEKGRYMVIGVPLNGFGTSTGSYMLKLLYQLATNMTGVHRPFGSTHQGESEASQNDFWRFDDWEVDWADVAQCPPDAAIWRHQLDLTERAEDVLAMQFEIFAFASHLYWNGLGGVLKLESSGSMAFVDDACASLSSPSSGCSSCVGIAAIMRMAPIIFGRA